MKVLVSAPFTVMAPVSVSVTVGGVNATYPFDVDSARKLFDAALATGPVYRKGEPE